MEERPKVGIGVFVIKDNKILLGKRKNSHGAGTWSLPGGHLEFKESWEDCARREVKEETNLNIENIKFCAVTNDIFVEENKHYITIFLLSDYKSGDEKIMEPTKCDEWQWFDWNNLPQPIFTPLVNLIKDNFNYYH